MKHKVYRIKTLDHQVEILNSEQENTLEMMALIRKV